MNMIVRGAVVLANARNRARNESTESLLIVVEAVVLIVAKGFSWVLPGKKLTVEELNEEGPRNYLSHDKR